MPFGRQAFGDAGLPKAAKDAAPEKPLQGLQKKTAEAKDDSQAAIKKALPSGVPLPGDLHKQTPSLARRSASRRSSCRERS